MKDGRSHDLTPRELSIARLVALGRADKEIARELGIRVSTVRTNLARIFRKMGVGNRAALAYRLPRHPEDELFVTSGLPRALRGAVDPGTQR